MIDYLAESVRYRNKAEEVRLIAESMMDAIARQMLMTVVSDYQQMADGMERLHSLRALRGAAATGVPLVNWTEGQDIH